MENKTAEKAKKGALSIVFSRTALILLLVVVQFLLMLGIATYLRDYVVYVYSAMNILGAVIVIYIINQRGNPAFNMTWVLLILIFPAFGTFLGFSTTSGEAFGIFAGTAVNDTSSVTATAATWDSLYHLGSATLDKAVTVKLTRTLAIIPITLGLAFLQTRKTKTSEKSISLKKIFPMFILYFILASVATTIVSAAGITADIFTPLKTLSKFFIVLAMAAIGLNTNIVKLIRTGARPLLLGFCCWVGITGVSLLLQHVMNLW